MIDKSLALEVRVITPSEDAIISLEIESYIRVFDLVKMLKKRYKIKNDHYDLFFVPPFPMERSRALIRNATFYEQAVFSGSKLEFRSNSSSHCIVFPDSSIKFIELNSFDSVYENISQICSQYQISAKYYNLYLDNGIRLDPSSSMEGQDVPEDAQIRLGFSIGTQSTFTTDDYISPLDLHLAFSEHQNAVLSSSLLVPDQSICTLAVISFSIILNSYDPKIHNEFMLDDHTLHKIFPKRVLSHIYSEKSYKSALKHLKSNVLAHLPNFRYSSDQLKLKYIQICSDSEWYNYHFYNCYQRRGSDLVHILTGVYDSNLVLAEGNPFNFTFISLSKMTQFHLLESNITISIAGNEDPYVFTSDSAVLLWFSLLKYYRGSSDQISFRVNAVTPKPILYQMNLIGSSFLIGQLKQKMVHIRSKMDSLPYFIKEVCAILDDIHIYLKQIRQENFQFKGESHMKFEFYTFFLKFHMKLDELDKECFLSKNISRTVETILIMLFLLVNLTEKISQSIHGGFSIHIDLLDSFQSIIRELNFLCDTISVAENYIESPNFKKALYNLRDYVIMTMKKTSSLHLNHSERDFCTSILEQLDIYLKNFNTLLFSFWTQTIVLSQLDESKIHSLFGELNNLKDLWNLLKNEIVRDMACLMETDLISAKLMQLNFVRDTVGSQVKEMKVVLAGLHSNSLLKSDFIRIKSVAKDIGMTISNFEHFTQIYSASKQLPNVFLNEKFCCCFYDIRALKNNNDYDLTRSLIKSVINSCRNFLHKIDICCQMSINDTIFECTFLLKDPPALSENQTEIYPVPKNWNSWSDKLRSSFSRVKEILTFMNQNLTGYKEELIFNAKNTAISLESELNNLVMNLISQDYPKYQLYFDSLISILCPVSDIILDLNKMGTEQKTILRKYRKIIQKSISQILEKALQEDKTKEVLTIKAIVKEIWIVVQDVFAPTSEVYKTLNYKILKLEDCFEFYDPLLRVSEIFYLNNCIRSEISALKETIANYNLQKFDTEKNQEFTEYSIKTFEGIKNASIEMCKYFIDLISGSELFNLVCKLCSFVSNVFNYNTSISCNQDANDHLKELGDLVQSLLEYWAIVFSPGNSSDNLWNILKQTMKLCMFIESLNKVLIKFRSFNKDANVSYISLFEYIKIFMHSPIPRLESNRELNIVEVIIDFIQMVKGLNEENSECIYDLYVHLIHLVSVTTEYMDIKKREEFNLDFLSYENILSDVDQLVDSVISYIGNHQAIYLSRLDNVSVHILDLLPEPKFSEMVVDYLNRTIFHICTNPTNEPSKSSNEILEDIKTLLDSMVVVNYSKGQTTLIIVEIINNLEKIMYYVQKIIIDPKDYLYHFMALDDILRKIEVEDVSSTIQQHVPSLNSCVKSLSKKLDSLNVNMSFTELFDKLEELTQVLEWEDYSVNDEFKLKNMLNLVNESRNRLVWTHNKVSSLMFSNTLNHAIYGVIGHLAEYFTGRFDNSSSSAGDIDADIQMHLWFMTEAISQFSSENSQNYYAWISLLSHFMRSKFDLLKNIVDMINNPNVEFNSEDDIMITKEKIKESLSKLKKLFLSISQSTQPKAISILISSDYKIIFNEFLNELVTFIKLTNGNFTDQNRFIPIFCEFLIKTTQYFAFTLSKNSEFYSENLKSLIGLIDDLQNYYLNEDVVEQVILIDKTLDSIRNFDGGSNIAILSKTKKETWQNICRLSGDIIQSTYLSIQTFPNPEKFKANLESLVEYLTSLIQVFKEYAQTRKMSQEILQDLENLEYNIVLSYSSLLESIRSSIYKGDISSLSMHLSNTLKVTTNSLTVFHSVLIDPYHSFNLELSEIASSLDGILLSLESGVFSDISINTKWDPKSSESLLVPLNNFKGYIDDIDMEDDYSFHMCLKLSIETLKNFWDELKALLSFSQVVPKTETNSILHLTRRVVASLQKFIVSPELLVLEHIRQKTMNLVNSIITYKDQISFMWILIDSSTENMKKLKERLSKNELKLVGNEAETAVDNHYLMSQNALMDRIYNSCYQFEKLWVQSYLSQNTNNMSLSYHEFDSQVKVFNSSSEALSDLINAVNMLVETTPSMLNMILRDQEQLEHDRDLQKQLQSLLIQLTDRAIQFLVSIPMASDTVVKEFRKFRSCITSILKILNRVSCPIIFWSDGTLKDYSSKCAVRLIQDVRVIVLNSSRNSEHSISEMKDENVDYSLLNDLVNYIKDVTTNTMNLIKTAFELYQNSDVYKKVVDPGSGGEGVKDEDLMNQNANSEDSKESETSEIIGEDVISNGGGECLNLETSRTLSHNSSMESVVQNEKEAQTMVEVVNVSGDNGVGTEAEKYDETQMRQQQQQQQQLGPNDHHMANKKGSQKYMISESNLEFGSIDEFINIAKSQPCNSNVGSEVFENMEGGMQRDSTVKILIKSFSSNDNLSAFKFSTSGKIGNTISVGDRVKMFSQMMANESTNVKRNASQKTIDNKNINDDIGRNLSEIEMEKLNLEDKRSNADELEEMGKLIISTNESEESLEEYDLQMEDVDGTEAMNSEPYFTRVFIFNSCYLALSISLFLNQIANCITERWMSNFLQAAYSVANLALMKLRKSYQISPQDVIIEADLYLDDLGGSMNKLLDVSLKILQIVGMDYYEMGKKGLFERLKDEIATKETEIEQRALVSKLEKKLSSQKSRLDTLISLRNN